VALHLERNAVGIELNLIGNSDPDDGGKNIRRPLECRLKAEVAPNKFPEMTP
jgi:hypothetical protein